MTTKAITESISNGVVGRVRERLQRAFKTFLGCIPQGFAGLRGVAPYAAIELILPGGSLIALALWFLQRKESLKILKLRLS
ncbi:MAG: hypothetical protein M3O26_02590 [Pseudomonadota bacterium]|nr:hypothetical protein [Pseudomonadota bacterium]